MIQVIDLSNYKYKLSYVIEGREVGYVIIEVVIDTINIIDVYVIEEYRRHNIATKLFDFLFSNYKDIRFMLEVRSKNISAINLYKKFNFNVIHIRKKYYKDDDALIMEVKN